MTVMTLAPDQHVAVCQAKRPYPSEQVALNAAWLIGLRNDVRLSTYRCHCCLDWHLSSTGSHRVDPTRPLPLTPRRRSR